PGLPGSPVKFKAAIAPSITIDSVTGTGGLVKVTYTIHQPESVRCDVKFELDDGSGYRRATQSASPSTGPNGIEGDQGVKTSAAGVQHTFAWNSATDLPSFQGSVTLRATGLLRGTAGTPSAAYPIPSINNFASFGPPGAATDAGSAVLSAAVAD